MKKLISIIGLALLAITSRAQSFVDFNDQLNWSPNNPIASIASYNVALTLPSVTANPAPATSVSFINVLGGSSTTISASSLIPNTTAAGNYNVFVQAVGTSGLLSPWSTNLVVTYVIAPNAPNGVNVIRIP